MSLLLVGAFALAACTSDPGTTADHIHRRRINGPRIYDT